MNVKINDITKINVLLNIFKTIDNSYGINILYIHCERNIRIKLYSYMKYRSRNGKLVTYDLLLKWKYFK